MNRILPVFFILLKLALYGQVQVDTLSIDRQQEFSFKVEPLKFPIVKSGNKKIDLLINEDLKNRFSDNEYPDQPVDSTLILWADNTIIYLDFNVSYNQKGIISLNISAEGCGANCTRWTRYFTYSVLTGKLLSIHEIMDISEDFRNRVINEQLAQLNKQRQELEGLLSDNEIDSGIYNWAAEYYEQCNNSFQIDEFALHQDYLELIYNCDLPRAIRNLTPIIVLKYRFAEIKEYLKI